MDLNAICLAMLNVLRTDGNTALRQFFDKKASARCGRLNPARTRNERLEVQGALHRQRLVDQCTIGMAGIQHALIRNEYLPIAAGNKRIILKITDFSTSINQNLSNVQAASQSVFYTHTRRWDIGLKLFRASIDILAEAFPNVDILIHLDHAQHDTDADLLESDLSMYSSVMYDASALPMEENIRKTREYVQRKGDELLIEGACDEIVDATGEARCEITDADKCERYMKETGVDIVVANLGTEHRASGQDLHYYYDAARAIQAKIGPRICLHGTSSVSNDQIGKLFDDGICKVNIWTALERDSSPALAEWIVKNFSKCAGPATEQKLINEGYLTESCKTGERSSLKHFTTAARQEIIFEEMKKITRGYLDLWYR